MSKPLEILIQEVVEGYKQQADQKEYERLAAKLRDKLK